MKKNQLVAQGCDGGVDPEQTTVLIKMYIYSHCPYNFIQHVCGPCRNPNVLENKPCHRLWEVRQVSGPSATLPFCLSLQVNQCHWSHLGINASVLYSVFVGSLYVIIVVNFPKGTPERFIKFYLSLLFTLN